MSELMAKPQDNDVLIQAARAGDREAFEKLISQERHRLRALLASRLNARIMFGVEVDDVYQETILRAFQSVGNFQWKGEDSFLRWLGGIGENVMFHLARKRARERRVSMQGTRHSHVASPSRAMRREERFQRLEDSLDELRPEHRDVIMLVRLEGLTFEQAAQRMGRSPDAVKQLLYRALRHLKSVFGDTESFHLPGRDVRRPEVEGNE